MTREQYTSAGTLADHFEYWRGRLGSDRAASDQVRKLYGLAPGSKLVRLPGAVMLETPDGLFDAALFATEPEPPVPLKADLSLFTPELEESLYGENDKKAAVLDAGGTSTPSVPAKRPGGKGRRLGQVWWSTIVPQIELQLARLEGKAFETLKDAVDAVVALRGFPWKRLKTRKAVHDGIRNHFKHWFKAE